MDKLSVDLLVSLASAGLSLLAYLIPPFRRWYEGQLGEWAPAFMAGVFLAVAVIYTGAWCAWQMACMKVEALPALMIWLMAIGANAAGRGAVKSGKQINAWFRR